MNIYIPHIFISLRLYFTTFRFVASTCSVIDGHLQMQIHSKFSQSKNVFFNCEKNLKTYAFQYITTTGRGKKLMGLVNQE